MHAFEDLLDPHQQRRGVLNVARGDRRIGARYHGGELLNIVPKRNTAVIADAACEEPPTSWRSCPLPEPLRPADQDCSLLLAAQLRHPFKRPSPKRIPQRFVEHLSNTIYRRLEI